MERGLLYPHPQEVESEYQLPGLLSDGLGTVTKLHIEAASFHTPGREGFVLASW